MCAKLSPSLNVKKLEKPSRRTEFGQFPVLILYIAAFGVQYLFFERKIHDICLAPTLGLGTFFCANLCLLLQEVFVQRNRIGIDLPLLARLVTQTSNCFQGGYNEHRFWIRLLIFTVGLTQLPAQEKWLENKYDQFICLMIIIVGIHLQWYDNALLESYRLEKPFSYSGGSAMAFSFYHGYLKIITPELVTRINHFKDNGGINDNQIPEKKLFILLPASSFIFDKLEGYQQYTKSQDFKINHVAENFMNYKQDRGLIKGRTYKNTMYIVECEEENYYILLEGATPVKTFYETCKEHNEFEKYKREVISSFYYTLRKLIKMNKDMKNVVELIYYDDEKRDVTISEIVKERILEKLRKRRGKKRIY